MKLLKQLWNIVQKTVTRWSRNDGNLLAASMAYYAAFSFFPLMGVLMSVLGFLLEFSKSAQNRKQQLIDLLAQNTAPSLAAEVDSILAVLQENAWSNSWYAAGILMLGAIGIFSQLESAFDRLWHAVTPHGPGVRAAILNALWNRLKAFLTLLGLGIVVIVAFVANVVLTAFRNWGEEEHLAWTSPLLPWLHIASGVILNAFVFSLVYKMIPRVPVRWRHALMGGAFVAVVWQLGSQLISRFLVGGRYTAYGVIGSFIVMMLWVYCASILLFLGAQLVQVLGHPEESSAAPLPPSPSEQVTATKSRYTKS